MSGHSNDDEFFVGYQPWMPKRLARFVGVLVALLVLGGVGAAWLLVSLHRPAAFARSDFGDIRSFEGILVARPAPSLLIPRPGETGDLPFSRYVLLGRGKSGPRIDVTALAGRRVRVTGSLVYRDSRTFIAVKGAEPIDASPTREVTNVGVAGTALGRFTLQGEIVDSKCYFGTMRPGHTKTHRGCAARCIAGGVPPVLLVRDPDGADLHFLLVGPEGDAIHEEVLPFVATPVEITGDVVRLGDSLVLHADPRGFERL